MGEVINLRRAKKAKLRSDKDQTAAQNRIKFGRTLSEKKLHEALDAKSQKALDGHRVMPTDKTQE